MAKKEKTVDYDSEALLGTIAIVVVSLALLFLMNMIFQFRRYLLEEELFFLLGNFFSIAIFLLSVYLIFIYLKDYLELRSRFTLGVLVMIISFMIFAITSDPMVHVFFSVYGVRGVFPLLPYIFATISLAILAWISSK